MYNPPKTVRRLKKMFLNAGPRINVEFKQTRVYKASGVNLKGYRMVKNFQLLAKFGLCSIYSQNLHECSLARARKIFATARLLGFSIIFARFLRIP